MRLTVFVLKALRKSYTKIFPPIGEKLLQEVNPDKVSDIIYNFLADDKPCMIGRYGATELSMVVNYLGITTKTHSTMEWFFPSYRRKTFAILPIDAR